MASILQSRIIEWETVEYGPNERNITGWGLWMSERSRKLVVEGGEKVVDFNIKAFKPAPAQGIDDALESMRAGMMFRYQPKTLEESHVSMFEKEFAEQPRVDALFGWQLAGLHPAHSLKAMFFTSFLMPQAPCGSGSRVNPGLLLPKRRSPV